MKIFSNLKSGFLKAALMLIMACPAAVSCYDDSALQEQIGILADKVFELEEKLKAELSALKSMLTGQLFISEVTRNAANGEVTIILSDGNELKLLPPTDLQSTVTYVTIGGVDYWAYIDEAGKKVLFKNEKGEGIPVVSEFPEVVVKDGESYLRIGGVDYPLSGNSVFSDYELITDELTGDVYAVTFTFGEDMTFTVTVDGANGFHFIKPTGWSSVIVSDWYVANGLTERVQVDARGVVDYVLQIPDGWRVKEYKDVYMGTLYFDITAPSKELVESGVAAAEGDLKVVAVLEGGKATVARLYLTTVPFRTFGVSLGNAGAEMYNGLQKFVYGVCAKAAFDEEAVFETASGLLDAFEYPVGYGVADADLSEPVATILGSEPNMGEPYVFWALPALYYMTADDAGYYLSKDTFVTYEFKYSSVTFEVSDEKFRDATLTMEVKGADAYYMSLVPAADFLLDDVLYSLNASYYDKITTPMTYTGSVFGLTGVAAEAATDYVVWLAVAEDGKIYSETDVLVREFSTLKLEAGGAVKVVAGEASASALEVSVPLTAEGAETIYYTYMTTSDAKKYADDNAKASYLLENGQSVQGTSANALLSEVIAKPKPSTSYVLMAVASDSDGKYGEVLSVDLSTTAITYNDLTVDIALVTNDPGNVVLSVEAKDAESLIYWIGKTSDNTWKSSNYMGGSVETAQEYMYLNSTHNRIVTVMEAYPIVDGLLTMKDLAYSEEYVIVVMAKDASGVFSKGYSLVFVPSPVALGKVVKSDDDKWAAAKPTVEFLPATFYAASGQMSGQYSFNVTIPAGFTGYVLSGTESYLDDGGLITNMTVEDRMIKIIQMVDKKRDSNVTVDYELWGEKGYPYGYEFYHHEHGNPLFGNVVIWASQEYHDSVCDCGGTFTSKMTVNNVEVDVEYCININDGKPLQVRQPYAVGSTTETIDKVFVICQDLQGNCYAPFEFDVPVDMFANAGSRDE